MPGAPGGRSTLDYSLTNNEMTKLEIYTDAAGYHRWRLKAANGEIVAVGEGYSTRAAAKRSAQMVKDWARHAVIVEINPNTPRQESLLSDRFLAPTPLAIAARPARTPGGVSALGGEDRARSAAN